MTTQWYALYSKPMKEAFLWKQLQLHEIESYYPCLRVQPANPHALKIKPYFPRYIFGHLDWEQIGHSTLNWMPGITGIVSFGGIPSPIPDNVIAAIKCRVDDINDAGSDLYGEWIRGDKLIIQEGPFRGFEAIFDAHISGEERVRILLKLLGKRQVPLQLPSWQIQRKKQ